MSLLLLGLAALLAAAVLDRLAPVPGGAEVRLPAALLATLPAAFFLVALFGLPGLPAEPPVLRAALLGFGWTGSASGSDRLTVGGDPDRHDVWVSALDPSETLTEIRFTEEDPEGAVLVPPAPSARATTALAGWKAAGERGWSPLAAVDLEPGDRILTGPESGETGSGSRGWTVGDDRLVGEPAIVLPRRTGRLPLVPVEFPLLRPRTGRERTHPLPVDDGSGFGTWVYREPVGVVGASLRLATTDPGLVVERDGGRIRPAGLRLRLPLPGHLHVLGTPRGRPIAGGFRDLRSFDLRGTAAGRTLSFDTPEIHVVDTSALDLLSLPGGPLSVGHRIPMSFGDWQPAEGSLHFRNVSRSLATEASAIVEWGVPPERLAGDSEFPILTPRGPIVGGFGRPIWLGAESRAAVQLDLLRAPSAWALLALAMALCRAVAARAAGLASPSLAVLAALEGILALRIVLGVRVWTLPPFDAEALELAAAVWMFLPWAWILLLGAGRRPRSRLAPSAAGLLASWAWCLAVGGSGIRSLTWTGLHLAVLVLALGLDRPGFRARLRRLDPAANPRAIRWAVLLGLGLVVTRISLLWIGFRESIDLGRRISLSLIHVPVGLLVEASYLAWLVRRRREAPIGFRELAPGLGILLALWVLPGLAVNDLGLTVLGIPAFLVAWTVVLAPAVRGLRGPWRRAPALPAWILFVWILVAGSPVAARALVAVLPESAAVELRSERNYLRLLGFAAPEELERVARRTSEEVAVMGRVMEAYTRGPWFGRGWRETEVSPLIEATALREHVPSVFVAGGWGVAGTLGLVALYLALLGGGEVLVDPARRRRPGPALLVSLAALGLAIPSLFMVLANHGLVPFTGKNAYLLGLDSTSDVLETSGLVLLMAVGTVLGREDT